jgi:hypothetical protein
MDPVYVIRDIGGGFDLVDIGDTDCVRVYVYVDLLTIGS